MTKNTDAGATNGKEPSGRTVLDAIPDLMFRLDIDGKFIDYHGADSELFLPPSVFLGKSVREVLPGFLADRTMNVLREVLTGGELRIFEYELNIKEHRRYFEARAVLNSPNDALFIIRDITSQRRNEMALRESNARLANALDKLKQAQQQIIQQERLAALGQMAGGIAHDFNNALMPILGYADLLLSKPSLTEDRHESLSMLEEIRRAARHASRAVRRMREFCRTRDEGEDCAIDLNRIVETTVEHTRPKWQEEMAARGIFIDMRTVLSEIGPVRGNETEIREALTNLILNAVDALPEGGVITLRTFAGNNGAVVEVNDNGVGMTDDIRQRCVEPFFSTKGGRGTGLGLAMVYGIVQRHEGHLDIQSEPGAGTTVSMRFPPADGESAIRRPKSDQDDTNSNPLRILFIDDESATRQLIQRFLTYDRHYVVLAGNGRKGIEDFKKDHFDLVIVDRAMPQMSGDQVAAVVKRIKPEVPVIMMTGFGDLMKDRQEYPPHVDMVLSKPVSREELRRAVLEACSKRNR